MVKFQTLLFEVIFFVIERNEYVRYWEVLQCESTTFIMCVENYGGHCESSESSSLYWADRTAHHYSPFELDAHTPVTRLEPNFPLEIKSLQNPAVAWYADNIKVLAHPSSQPPAQAQSLSIESSDDSDNAVSEEVSSDNSDYIPKRYMKRQPWRKSVKIKVTCP